MAFTRYGDYPMAAYTGLTDITIPLHTVTGRKLSLPVTMSFHASGRMANEINGTLGMRWTLNCGGLVTRTMKGQPDEWDGLTQFDITPYINTSNNPSFDVLHSACPDGKIHGYQDPNSSTATPIYDSEYDIFSYALPNGKQGHFILKNVNGTKVPMTIPYESLKIEITKEQLYWGYFIENIKITDIDGIQYFFGKLDASTVNAIEVSEEWTTPIAPYLDNAPIPTAWYLTKIVSSDGTDQISFSYNSPYQSSQSTSQNAKIEDNKRNSSVNYTIEDCQPNITDPYECNLMNNEPGYTYYFYQSPPGQITMQPILKRVPVMTGVQFNGGSVQLNYDNTSTFVTEMIINRGTTPYKKIAFNLTKHSGEDVLYYLDGISFYGEDQNTINEKYSFSYYEANGLNGQYPSANRDWWGYYTGYVQNLLPYRSAESVTNLSNGGGYQDVGFQNVQRGGDANSKKMGMLKTITYPTGGNTEFIYEGNMYNYGDAPGLRVGEIISKPVGGNEIHKIYKYGINEDGYGNINEYLRPGSISFKNLMVAESNTMHFWDYDANAGGGFPWYFNEQMGYRTRNYFSDPYIRFDLGGSQIKYNAVSEYYLDENGNSRQKTQTVYNWGDDEQLNDFIVHDYDNPIFYPRKYSDPQNACLRPVMTSKTIFKYSSGNFEPTRKETYNYGSLDKDEAWDMPTYLHTNVVWARQAPGTTIVDNFNAAKNYHDNSCSVYGYGFRKYKSSSQKLYSTTVEEYTPNGTITTQTNMDYDPNYHFTTYNETTDSKNQTVKTTYKYPFNYPTIPVYQEMINRNIISPVIEEYTENTTLNKELNRSKKNYSFFQSNTIIAPSSIQKSILGNTLVSEGTIDNYDNKGNVLQITDKTGIVTAYLWGYDQKNPVAKIVNTTYAIAQTYITQSILDNPADDATLRNHLNNLRNIPRALVSTYTYKPLVGITSETDPTGKTIYYEYDAFGRLIIIRDKDNNIIKKICYNYAGQPENCTISCPANPVPIWQNTIEFRCQVGACGGYTGYQEQKQIDVNWCTNYPPQWILAGYNPGICPVTNCIALTSTNLPAATGYVASYYNNTTGVTYNLPVPATTGLQSLGSIPEGTYTLTISRVTGTPVYATFYSGCGKKSQSGTSAIFYSVPISSTGCLSIKIDFAQ
ncbi:MAG: RHS repeat protein [Bacteroidetes bacterium]|nr:RHS repeat protein [Bacteroidota bacterium]